MLIVSGAGLFIYKEVVHHQDLGEVRAYFVSVIGNRSNLLLFLLALFFMFINWGIESVKWKYLVKKIENVSLLKSIVAVFSGVTISAFTPNRVGEFAGRVFYLRHADRLQATLITILGSFSQLLVTIIFGGICFLVYLTSYTAVEEFNRYILIFLVLVLTGLLLLVFLNASVLTTLLNKISFLKKYGNYSEVFSYYSTGELVIVLIFSFIRYVVFTLQYYLLLKAFGVDISISEAVVFISLTFFAMTAIPSIALSEMGVREVVAIHFIGLISANKIGIVAAAFSLWIINLVIPALIGCLFVFGLKFFRASHQ